MTMMMITKIVLCRAGPSVEHDVQVLGYGVQVLGYGVQVLGYGVQVLGYGVQVLGYGVQVLGYGVQVLRDGMQVSLVTCTCLSGNLVGPHAGATKVGAE